MLAPKKFPFPYAPNLASGFCTVRRRTRFLKEFCFRWTGLVALMAVLGTLFFLLFTVFFRGYGAFFTTEMYVTVSFDTPLTSHNFESLLSQEKLNAFFALALAKDCSFLQDPFDQLEAAQVISWGAGNTLKKALKKRFKKSMEPISQASLWVLTADEVDGFYKEKTKLFAPKGKDLSPLQIKVLQTFISKKKVRLRFNYEFLQSNDSTMPELAGICGAFWGSVFVLLVSFALAFPLGLGTALYLEELAPKNWWVAWVDVKLSNLASVPSVLFGLLSFILFDYWLGLPRPSPLMGGLTIGLMMAPLLMVTTRVALQTVPRSIRIAASALGASHAQIMLHHVLPMALPQIITATLLTLARALGETAPVLMVGMVAFVGDTPTGFTGASTTLPAQIFSWARNSELGFLPKTSGGILALFFLLTVLNGLAFWVRRLFQRES